MSEQRRRLHLTLLDLDFWLRSDVPVWRYSKDELLDQRGDVLAAIAALDEGQR